MLEQLQASYIETLKKRQAAYHAAGVIESPPVVIATRMLAAAVHCAMQHNHQKKGCNWLAHNEALCEACAEHGITTSKQLREYIQKQMQIK